MKIVTLAAGFAAGYVLGTRAGREKYEQIAASARKLSASPTVQQAQEKAKTLLSNGADAATTKLHEVTSSTDSSDSGSSATSGSSTAGAGAGAAAVPAPPRRKPATVNGVSPVAADPVV